MHASTFFYVRWKALLFGGVLTSLAVLMMWVGLASLDPTWTAQVTKGQYLVNSPNWIRAPIIVGAAVFCAMPGLWQLCAGLLRWPIVQFDDQRIEARTSFGRVRRLAWKEIAQVKRKKNQLILSPTGINTLGQEIWDRKSIILDVGMLEVSPQAIEDLIARHRPELPITA